MDGLQLIGVFFLFSTVLTAADPEANLLVSGCSPVKSTNVTLFNENLNAVLAALRAKIASSGFATDQVDLMGTDPVYALAQCRKDKTTSDCLKCITVAEKQVRNCSAVTGGRVVYDGCFLRYESHNFYAQITDQRNRQFCGANKSRGDTNQFSGDAQSLLSDLIAAAPKSEWLFAAQTKQGPSNTTIYALASCLRSINESGCSQCLGIAERNILNCLPQTALLTRAQYLKLSSAEGRAVDAGCYLRYATHSFFPSNLSIPFYLPALLSSGNKNRSRTWIIIGVAGGLALIFIMVFIVVFIASRCLWPDDNLYVSLERSKRIFDCMGEIFSQVSK